MISIRKHLDEYADPAPGWFVAVFDSLLRATGEHCQRAATVPERDLPGAFENICTPLRKGMTRPLAKKAAEEVSAELARWADGAQKAHEDDRKHLREMIGVMARTAESAAERDGKYSHRFNDLNGRLRSIAEISDVQAMRRSVVEMTAALSRCVVEMIAESKDSVEKLNGEIAECRTRLVESERLSATDALTGLASRRAIETSLRVRIASRTGFSVLMVDLNGFKDVNDRHGHAAGDALLRDFAQELTAQFGPGDLVGRWGGDEFLVLVSGGRKEAENRVDRVKRWALGEYQVPSENRKVRVKVDAAIGCAEWDGTESGAELLARADKRVYEGKGYDGAERRARVRTQTATNIAGELVPAK